MAVKYRPGNAYGPFRMLSRLLYTTTSARKLSQAGHRSPRPAVSHLESECKFNVNASLESFLADSLHLQHRSTDHSKHADLLAERQPDRIIQDQYFDRNGQLAWKGLWVRKRTELITTTDDLQSLVSNEKTTTWEAKYRLGGDYVNSAFEEIHGERPVRAAVRRHLPGSSMYELPVMAGLETFRKSWVVREATDLSTGGAESAFLVVVDHITSTDSIDSVIKKEQRFRHVVGEVEVTRDIEAVGGAQEVEERKKEELARMEMEIGAFMRRYPLLFPLSPAPIGKLTAYFAWKSQVQEYLKGNN